MHANTEVPPYDTSTDIDVCYEGYRQKATGQKATGQKATRQKATETKGHRTQRQGATELLRRTEN